MNNTVTLSQLITRLSKVAGTDTNTSRKFLRSFFSAIEDALAEGQSVTIKGIGTFRKSEEIGNTASQVIFIPDEQLASEINAPFGMFEPVVLADGVDFKDEEIAEPIPAPIEEPETIAETIDIPTDPEPVPEPEEEKEKPAEISQPVENVVSQLSEKVTAEPKPAKEIQVAAPEVIIPEPQKLSPEREDEEAEPEETYTTEETSRKKPWLLWVGCAILIVAGCLGGYLAAVLDDETPSVSINDEAAASEEIPTIVEEVDVNEISSPAQAEETTSAPQETPKEETAASTPQPEAPAQPEVRYDTVTSTRYLATMAREYYGKGIYWVYIYEANTDVLNNPNQIKPGTRVRIPEKSSFAAATEAETSRIAERKQAELFKRFK